MVTDAKGESAEDGCPVRLTEHVEAISLSRARMISDGFIFGLSVRRNLSVLNGMVPTGPRKGAHAFFVLPSSGRTDPTPGPPRRSVLFVKGPPHPPR